MREWSCLAFVLAVLMPWVELGDTAVYCWQAFLGTVMVLAAGGTVSAETLVFSAVFPLLMLGLFASSVSVRKPRWDRLKWVSFLSGLAAFALPLLVYKSWLELTLMSLGQPMAAVAAILSLTPSD